MDAVIAFFLNMQGTANIGFCGRGFQGPETGRHRLLAIPDIKTAVSEALHQVLYKSGFIELGRYV